MKKEEKDHDKQKQGNGKIKTTRTEKINILNYTIQDM